jgi:hypothetical protein
MAARRAVSVANLYESRATCEAMVEKFYRVIEECGKVITAALIEYHKAEPKSRHDATKTDQQLNVINAMLYSARVLARIEGSHEYRIAPSRELREAYGYHLKKGLKLGSARAVWYVQCQLKASADSLPFSLIRHKLETALGRTLPEITAPLDKFKARFREDLPTSLSASVAADYILNAAEKLKKRPKDIIKNVNLAALPDSSIRTVVREATQAELDATLTVTSTDPESPHTDGAFTTFLSVAPGRVWVALPVGACPIEAKRMGHCGNVGQSNPGDRLLSLRIFNTNDQKWRVHATAVLNTQNKTGKSVIVEIVGQGNSDPFAKYGRECDALLDDPRIAFVIDQQRWGYIGAVSAVSKDKLFSGKAFVSCGSCGENIPGEVFHCVSCPNVLCVMCATACETPGCSAVTCPAHERAHARDHMRRCPMCDRYLDKDAKFATCADCHVAVCTECQWVCPHEHCDGTIRCLRCAGTHRSRIHLITCARLGCRVEFVDPKVIEGEQQRKCSDCGRLFCSRHIEHPHRTA